MPTQDQYESYDKQVREQNLEGILSNLSLQADIQKFKDIGDASRIAMILQVIKHQSQKDQTLNPVENEMENDTPTHPTVQYKTNIS